ncbi:hypothetical protein [Pseudomonas sp.]|uniref:hypothetical protein n=1 Tax=Pseudomonas sp. TaxID=306 RepID=UPI002585367C|nr:hypothetical protein [Pseudomonas sp.]
MGIPDDVRAAFKRRVKSVLLGNYVCDRRKLEPWDDFRASVASINSGYLGSDTRKGLRRLVSLAATGAIIEKPRYSTTAPRSFTLPREQLDELALEATREHEAAGYVLGMMMPTIRDDNDCEV